MRHAGIALEIRKYWGSGQGTKTAHILRARLPLAAPVTSFDPLANSAARTLLNSDPAAASEDVISVTVVYGYDIGIASRWRHESYALSPAQWRKRLAAGQTPL